MSRNKNKQQQKSDNYQLSRTMSSTSAAGSATIKKPTYYTITASYSLVMRNIGVDPVNTI
jgi:hypothetical protein